MKLWLVFIFTGLLQASFAAAQPNIVLFLIDDLGWKDVGCYGSDYYKTPNIDRLAARGVRFTNGYAACAVCSPTRAAILTGKYPARLMLTEWLPSGRWNPKAKLRSGRFLRALPLEEITLAEALRKGGYRTLHVGKWHLGGPPFALPAQHGFDVNVGGSEHGAPGHYFYPYTGRWKIPTTNERVQKITLPNGKEGEYLTDRLTSEALALIEQDHDKPFFLHFSHYAVHTPFQAKDKITKKYEKIPEAKQQGKPIYAAMVQSVDESVGRVMSALKKLNKLKNTLVIFTSDNGGFAKATNHTPLRGNKGSYYEGGIRVPFIIHWPAVTKAGHVSNVPVISMDLYPTCLTAAGLPPHPAQHRDGLNLLPLVKGSGTLKRDALHWHYPHYNSHPSSVPSSVLRKGDWKLIETFDPEGVELYHLGRDLSETTNLAAKEPAKLSALRQELADWRKKVGAERMEPNPDYQKETR